MGINRARQIWESALGDLQLQVTRPSYETWLKGTVGLSLLDNRLLVGIPNTFAAEMLENRMYSLISQAVERVTRRPLEVQFNVLTTGSPAAESDTLWHEDGHNGSPSGGAIRPAHNGSPLNTNRATLNPKYTFNTFIVGKSNDLANAAATAVAERPGRLYNPLLIYSDVGLGKTHLLHSIGHQIGMKRHSFICISCEEFTNEYIRSIRNGSTEDFRNKYRSVDILLLDDIQFIIGKEQTQEGFFHTFNTLHMSNRQIVVTSDRPIRSLTLLEKRIRSRLEGGLVVDIQTPDIETRQAILKAKAEAMGAQVHQTVIEYLSKRVENNIRELEGALNRLVAYAQLTQRAITIDMVSSVLADILPLERKQKASHTDILNAVSSYYGIAVSILTGSSRDSKTVRARQVAMYIMREDSGKPLKEVGLALGHKDHTTVRHACHRISTLLDTEPQLRQDILTIRQLISKG